MDWSTLRYRLNDVLGDSLSFTPDRFFVWALEAILDYSQYFPRKRTTAITVVNDYHYYELPEDFKAAAAVYYQDWAGSDPVYLKQHNLASEDFWTADKAYDIIRRSEDSSETALYPQLVVGAFDHDLAAGSYVVDYDGNHAIPLMNQDGSQNDYVIMTFPEAHFHLIFLFVRWQALTFLATEEQISPTLDSGVSRTSQYELNAQRAEKAYRGAIAAAIKAGSDSAVVPWTMDKWQGRY